MFIIFLFIFQTLISGDDEVFEENLKLYLKEYTNEDLFLANQNKMKELRSSYNLKRIYSSFPVRYKLSYKHLNFFPHVYHGLYSFTLFLFLSKKYSLSKNYKSIFSVCSLSFLFLPLFISIRSAKKFHYSLTYENMLNNFEKLRAEVFTKKVFSFIDRKTIFIDYYNNFFKKTDFYTYEYNDIRKYKILMNFFLAENNLAKKDIIKEFLEKITMIMIDQDRGKNKEPIMNFFLAKNNLAKKEIIKKYFEEVIMIDQDRKKNRESIFFPKNPDKFFILELSDEQCLKIIDRYYKDKIDEFVEIFNQVYLEDKKRIEDILSKINEDILLKILLNQKLSQDIYTYIMENFRFEIASEINKKYGDISRIKEEVEFSNYFETYENKKREIENAKKEEEQKTRDFFFQVLNLENIFQKNINNPFIFFKLIYKKFFYNYEPIVSFFNNCYDSHLDNIAKILSYLFYYDRYFILDENKDSKELFFKIITSTDFSKDVANKVISSKLFRVSEKDFESVLSFKFCYGKKEAVKRYHELLTALENKNKILL